MIKDIRRVLSPIDVEKVAQAYCDIYGEAPWNEKWSMDEALKVCEQYAKEGILYGTFWCRELTGFIAIMPYEVGVHPVKYGKNERILYLSDVAVLSSYRKNGIGSNLIKRVIRYAKKFEYDRIYLRTNKVGSMSKSIAMKLGFTVMEGVEQEVMMERTGGKVEPDTRIFLELVL